jgi:peptide/nickel transport system ATP-binding protein
MRQRVMIAMALSSEPELVIADEPTTALDVSVQAQILELLRKVTSTRGTSMLMISHDLSVVAGLADRVAVMYAGRLVDVGTTELIFEHPQHPYTIGLLQCIPSLTGPPRHRLHSIEGSPPDLSIERAGCSFAPRCPFVMDRCHIEDPRLESKEPGQSAACWADLSSAAPLGDRASTRAPEEKGRAAIMNNSKAAAAAGAQTKPLVRVTDLRVHFPVGTGILPGRRRGVVKAVDGLTFDIRRGETLSLVGESGSGKSTTARALLQVERISSGTVEFDGHQLNHIGAKQLRELRPHMQMVFQDPYGSLNPRRSVGATVAEPLIVHSTVPRRQVAGRVAELLDTVGLSPRTAARYPHELSGGQRQRVSIARALALRPTLIVADEPTSALDVSVRAQILNLMQDLQVDSALTYLFISHDLSVVSHMSTRVAVMYLGQIVEIADRDELYGNPQHPYTQALLSVVPIADPRLEKKRRRSAISGEIPSPANPPSGCRFHPRCPLAFDRCRVEEPPLMNLGGDHAASCFLAKPRAGLAVSTALEAQAVTPNSSRGDIE